MCNRDRVCGGDTGVQQGHEGVMGTWKWDGDMGVCNEDKCAMGTRVCNGVRRATGTRARDGDVDVLWGYRLGMGTGVCVQWGHRDALGTWVCNGDMGM